MEHIPQALLQTVFVFLSSSAGYKIAQGGLVKAVGASEGVQINPTQFVDTQKLVSSLVTLLLCSQMVIMTTLGFLLLSE